MAHADRRGAAPIPAKRTPTKSAFTNSCNGTPSASSSVAATSRAGAAFRSGSISTPRSASMPRGADAWMAQGIVLRGLSVGAPPDQFNPAGQDWGLTAYNPHGLVASRLRAVPPDAARRHAPRRRGADRSRARPDAALRHSARLAARARARICACRSPRCWRSSPRKAGAGIASPSARTSAPCRRTFAPRCRPGACGPISSCCSSGTGDGSFRRPEEYPEHAIATFNTHDLPTFAGWMSGHDLQDQARHRRRSRRDRGRAAPFARDVLRGARGGDRPSRHHLRGGRRLPRRDADPARLDRDRGCARISKTRSTCRAR